MTLYDVLEVAKGTIVIKTKQANILTYYGGEYDWCECLGTMFLTKKVESIFVDDNQLVVCIEGFS